MEFAIGVFAPRRTLWFGIGATIALAIGKRYRREVRKQMMAD